MKFEKVSLKQYIEDSKNDIYYSSDRAYSLSDLLGRGSVNFTNVFQNLRDLSVEDIYNDIKLPTRATRGSAGYDFYAPYDFTLAPGESIRISTGIRFDCDYDKFLACLPRSGHGFKARVQLDNTIGIIDADYYESSNEGHIIIKLTNDSNVGKHITVKRGDGMIQGIILPYFTVDDDNTSSIRDGGFGSTDK